jgi:ubiquinone/menaquinone biosynthesis C-methylase UbiE
MSERFKSGSTAEFDENWKLRKETRYNHWRRASARNQIQLAFRSHFQVFSAYLKRDGAPVGRCLEIGAGRGSISSFFADAGYSCTLLDTSATVLEVAQEIYARNGHKAAYVVGDANRLEFPDGSYDVVVSIGLLEHFEDIETPLREQLRVLRPGGRCFCYVVPENPDNVQKYFRFINTLLRWRGGSAANKGDAMGKKPIYRTASLSRDYVTALSRMSASQIEATGMYPMPMISPSPEFPFTLMHPVAEFILTGMFRAVLAVRSVFKREHPWTCDEQMGQAFLVTFRKS